MTIARLPNDQYTFCEEAWRQGENPLGDHYEYWFSILDGGLYSSFEKAEMDARATISWFRDDAT